VATDNSCLEKNMISVVLIRVGIVLEYGCGEGEGSNSLLL
jgi:hypothetical protein